MGGVCHAADITVGIAGSKGTFTAFVLDADIPALLRKGALEALAGQLDFARNALTLGSRGVEIPLQVNDAGHYILSVANFHETPARYGAPSDLFCLPCRAVAPPTTPEYGTRRPLSPLQ